MLKNTQKKVHEEQVRSKALHFFYLNLVEVSWLQMIFPIVVTFIFFDIVDRELLFSWLVLVLGTFLARLILTWRYLKMSPPPSDTTRWGWYLTITTFISGLLWGYAAFSFHDPINLYNNVLIYLIVISFSAGSMMLTSYWPQALYAYTLPAVGGAILDQLLHMDPPGYTFAYLLLLFLVMLFKVAKGSNNIVYNALRVSAKNHDLIQKMEVEKNKAETASQAKTSFLASANHDLRQPVHALSLLVHGLKKELRSAQGKLLFLRLERSVNNLGNLLESLLDLSRLDASAVKVTPTNFPMSIVSSQMLAEFLPLAREKGLRFSIRHCNEYVFTDRTLLERLLRNLLNNSFRYTHNGGILLGFRKRGDYLIFEVWDTGIGIAKDEKDKIFNEFYQSENAERDRSKGLGLGLSICQRITALLDSELSYTSTEGRGSVFRFQLPIALIEPRPAIITEPAYKKVDLTGKILLIVDDDIEVLQAMIQLTKNWNMQPLTARNGNEAFDVLEARHLSPDAIICDHRLGDSETGIDVIKQIQHRFNIPALMITGDTAPENLLALEHSGFPILHKPVSPDVLFRTLSQLLSD